MRFKSIDEFFPSSYLRSSDLPDGDVTLTIDCIESGDFDGVTKPIVRFEETDKSLALNRTNAATIRVLYGADYEKDWPRKRIQLFRQEIDFRGKPTLAIRIRPRVPKSSELTKNPPF